MELVVGMMLLGMLMAALYSCAEMLHKSQLVTNARVEPRQQLRHALNRFALFSAGATVFYTCDQATPSSHQPFTINGYECNLPYYQPGSSGNPGVWHEGDSVAIAVPEDLTRPQDDQIHPIPDSPSAVINMFPVNHANAIPDGFPDGTHTVVVLTAQLRPEQRRDRDARSLILMSWEQVGGAAATPRQAESIDLEGLGKPDRIAFFDTYLKPGDEGFLVRYLRNPADVPYACEIRASFRHTAEALRTVSQEETYNYTFATRNL